MRYAKGNREITNTSLTIRKTVLSALLKYMQDSTHRNRSVAIESILENFLKEKGYLE